MITLIFVAFKGDTTQNMKCFEFQHWLKEKPCQICFEWQIFFGTVHTCDTVPHLLGINFFSAITFSK
jgi:hypothetical protein